MQKSSIAFLVFSLNTMVLLWGEVVFSKDIILITKPLLMPLLAVWLWLAIGNASSKMTTSVRNIWMLGLLFSTVGDVLLMFTGRQSGGSFFLGGLSAFLCAHLCYIFGLNTLREGKPGLVQKEPEWVLLFLGYIGGFLWFLWQGIPDAMKAPVTVYALVISTMMICVLQLRDDMPRRVFWVMFAGAILFALSDSMIALNKFGAPFPYARVAIMVTYIAGQAMLAWGVQRTIRVQRD